MVVSYTTDPEIQSGRKLLDQGVQTVAGVPLPYMRLNSDITSISGGGAASFAAFAVARSAARSPDPTW